MARLRKLSHRLKIIWWRILVFFGFRQWARMQYNRPKFSRCAYHGIMMKRQGKTEFGAFYYCPKCKRSYLLDCKGNKLVPCAESEITKPWFVPMKPISYSIEGIFSRFFGRLR